MDLISFVNGKIKKYVTVGKRISNSFKRAQPEVSSFIRLGDTLLENEKSDTLLENEKSDFAVDEEKIADRIGIARF